MDSMKIAAYVRVSTEEQAREGLSIEGQIESIKKYCALYNSKSEIDFFIDMGYSGRNVQRKELKEMLKNITEYNQLVVWKLDRLSRSLFDSVWIIDELLANDVALISIEEKIDCGTPAGRAFINIIMTFAQLEVENTSERTKLGLLQKSRNGEYPFSVLPYGYVMNDKRKLIPDEEKRELINKVYQMYYKESFSLNHISKTLYSIYPEHSLKQMEKIVHRVLKNRIYVGEFTYQGETNLNIVEEPVIVDNYYKNLFYKTPEKNKYNYTSMNIYCKCGMRLYNTAVKGGDKTYKYKCCSKCNKRINTSKLTMIISDYNNQTPNNDLNNSKSCRYIYDFESKEINLMI